MTKRTRPPKQHRLRSLRLDVHWSEDDHCFVLTTEPDLGIGHVAFDYIFEAVGSAAEEVEEQFESEDIERGVAEYRPKHP